MTPEEAAFVELVCASPDSDAPRLIFADWLDEREDPRGEFIRIQCALARMSSSDPARNALLDREAVLIALHHAQWSEPLKGIASWTEFRRGFIETVNMETRKFLARGKDLYSLAPIRHVRFLDVGSNLTRLMATPLLGNLTAMTLYAQHLGDDLASALVESAHFSSIRQLFIGRNRIGDRGIQRLVRSPRLADVQFLDLSDNSIRDTGVRTIAESAHLSKLNHLELRRNEITRQGLASLSTSNTLARLAELGLALNNLGTPQETEAPIPGCVSLESLDLGENSLNLESLRETLSLPGLENLRRLDLTHNEIGSAGAVLLANWSGSANLRQLRLAGNRIGDEGARALARSRYFHHLTELDVSDNPMHDPGAFELLNSSSMPRMSKLSLPHLGMTPRMRRALAERYNS